MKNIKVIFVISIWLLAGSSLLSAEDFEKSTNFMGQDPSSEQLIEALKTVPQFNFRGITIQPVRPKVLLDIKFDFDSAKLTQEAKLTLSSLGQAFKSAELKGNCFFVEGHTDGRGAARYNHKLSTIRAVAVTDYLVKQYGVDSSTLTPVGKGETELLDIANPESEDNRRVEVINMGRKNHCAELNIFED
jgi:OOP family OmpA-OmpF porin